MADNTNRFGLNTYSQGDTNWDHTDTVETIDELAIERGAAADRPASGDYDDELYLATDQQILYRWDETETDWIVEGVGSETDPLPKVWANEVELTNGASFGSFTINEFSATLDEDDSTTWIEIQSPRSDGRSSAIVFASLSGRDGNGLWQYSASGDFSDRSNDDMNLSNSGPLELRLSDSTLEIRTDSTGFEDEEVKFAVGKMRFS